MRFFTRNPSPSTIETAIKSYNTNNDPQVWNQKPNYDETRKFFGKSFAGNGKVSGEPMCDWMVKDLVEHEEWFTTKEHQEAFTFFMGFAVYEAFQRKPLVIQKKDNATGDVVSTAIVVEYDPKRAKSLTRKLSEGWNSCKAFVDMILFKEGLPELVTKHKKASKRVGKKAKVTMDSIMKYHSNKGPTSKHWYVNMVGVNPDYNGKGHGGELMSMVAKLADETEGVSLCYLECGASNRGFYEKCGYKVVAKHIISDPDDTSLDPLEGYVMTRDCSTTR